jgi:hypothetical protein
VTITVVIRSRGDIDVPDDDDFSVVYLDQLPHPFLEKVMVVHLECHAFFGGQVWTVDVDQDEHAKVHDQPTTFCVQSVEGKWDISFLISHECHFVRTRVDAGYPFARIKGGFRLEEPG